MTLPTHRAMILGSVRVLARPPDPKGHQQDLEVEPHRPALDIFEIIDDAKPRLVEVIDLAALPMDLGPTGYARLYPVPVEILFDGVIIELVAGFHRNRMRAGADQ